MTPTFFPTAKEFRGWLAENSATKEELLVGFYKVKSGIPCMTWSESVDQALCFGWIDGVRKSIDDKSYTIRFTPRRKNSIWCKINLKKMENLIACGQMEAGGLAIYESRNREKEGIYSFERPDFPEFAPRHLEQFKANEKAWAFFEAQPPGFRKLAIHRVSDAKREETRLSRLEKLIADSEMGIRHDPYGWEKKKPS